jgi:hypothetical protein
MPEFHSPQREFKPMYAAANAAAPTPDRIRDEMRHKIRAIAGLWSGDGLKGALAWAARQAGITPNQAKRLAYAEMATVPTHIADRVRAAAERVRVDHELAAVDALLARIQEDDLHAAAARNLVARLRVVATAPPAQDVGESSGPG